MIHLREAQSRTPRKGADFIPRRRRMVLYMSREPFTDYTITQHAARQLIVPCGTWASPARCKCKTCRPLPSFLLSCV